MPEQGLETRQDVGSSPRIQGERQILALGHCSRQPVADAFLIFLLDLFLAGPQTKIDPFHSSHQITRI